MGQNQNQLRDSEVERLGRGGKGRSKEGNVIEGEEKVDMWWCWCCISMDFSIDVDRDIVSVFLKKEIITISRMFLMITRSLPWSD